MVLPQCTVTSIYWTPSHSNYTFSFLGLSVGILLVYSLSSVSTCFIWCLEICVVRQTKCFSVWIIFYNWTACSHPNHHNVDEKINCISVSLKTAENLLFMQDIRCLLCDIICRNGGDICQLLLSKFTQYLSKIFCIKISSELNRTLKRTTT